jgi:proline iminopeptidase
MELFSPIEPFASGMLPVDGIHTLYWEQSGNPAGRPVLFIHGGPGAGTAPIYRRFFDPAFYRIILFDQRGAGRSTPTAEIRANTTADLVGDIERLRRHLEIETWLIFGGSWGSTLALAYGETHPAQCIGFILRGIFLFRQSEVDWFMTGMRTLFPEAWRRFRDFIPPEEQDDLLTAYHRRLTDGDPAVHRAAASAWCAYEDGCSRLVSRGFPSREPAGPGQVAMARIEAHYMMNKGFLADGALLRGLSALARHPVEIVQGRYDAVCPIVTADELAGAWPDARFTIVEEAGHSAMEKGIRAALVASTQRFREIRPASS